MVKIALGADHAGFPLKVVLHSWLTEMGHEVSDLGTDSTVPVDYPRYAEGVGRRVISGDCDFGLMLGGSGQGEQIAANKVKGVRAALCNDLYTARMARAHNDANVLTLGARIVASELAKEIVQIFLTTPFEGGRHLDRVRQISEIEGEAPS